MQATSLNPDVSVFLNQPMLSPALSAWQQQARDQISDSRFPSRKDESWRYVPHRQLPPLAAHKGSSTQATDNSLDLDVYRVCFVDGVLVSADSVPGVTITNLADCDEKIAAAFAHDLVEKDAWITLNQAYLTHGVFIQVDTAVELDKPIMLIDRVTDAVAHQWLQPRHLISLGAQSKVDVIHYHVGQGELPCSVNSVSCLVLAKHARCSYLRVQDLNQISTCLHQTECEQAAGSEAKIGQFLFGGSVSRDAVHVTLQGQEARTDLSGVYYPTGKQFMNIYTHLTHAVPNTHANQSYRGIVCDKGQGVFYGRVHVLKDAQKTASYQRNANLLLGSRAKVNTKPELEIYADDVICSHGATVGQLDEEQLFYLRSRGIPENQANALLIDGFAHSSTDCWKDSPAYDLLLAGVEKANQRVGGE